MPPCSVGDGDGDGDTPPLHMPGWGLPLDPSPSPGLPTFPPPPSCGRQAVVYVVTLVSLPRERGGGGRLLGGSDRPWGLPS